jgi:hypothetical protein
MELALMCVQSQYCADPFISTLANVYSCSGLRVGKERLKMALLTAYFDESGVHGQHSCVIAGFVGNDAQWQSLASDWIKAIKPRTNIHMKKLRWNQHPERIAPLLAKLGPIPHKYNLKPVTVSLSWSHYNSIVKGNVDERFTNPYIVAAWVAIAVVMNQIAANDDVLFIFDRQEGRRRETMEYMRDVLLKETRVDSRIKNIDLIDRKGTVCLDPADYLAFAVRERGISLNSTKAILCAPIIGTEGFGGRISEDQLRWMVEGWQRPEVGDALLREWAATWA